MNPVPKILFVVPPVRLHREELEYLIHWPRHAIVLSAELAHEFEVQILDITAEFHRDPESRHLASQSSPAGVPSQAPLAPVLHNLVTTHIATFDPDIVVVHAHAAPAMPIVKLTFDAIIEAVQPRPKHQRPKVVVGGMAANYLPQVVADWAPDGTWVVRGTGVGRIRDVMDVILGNREPDPLYEPVTQITGQRSAVSKSIQKPTHTDTIFMRPPATEAHVLNLLPKPVANAQDGVIDYSQPRFDLLRMDTYTELFRENAFVPHLEASAGCTFPCNFCGVHDPNDRRHFRQRPVNRVIDELKELKTRFGFDEFYFCDETFTLNTEHSVELCEAMIREVPGIRWRCVTRVDRIHDELAAFMRRAGCYEIGFGIEVGSAEVLNELHKGATTEQCIEAFRMVRRHGIAGNALTIIANWDEDHSHIRRTFEYLARFLKPDRCQIFIFHPVPGTQYFEHPEAFGLRFDTRNVDEWYKWDHIGEPVCETQFLSREDIARYFMLFNRAFSTIVDEEADPQLVDRILNNRFPVRRKGIAWAIESDYLRIYRPVDPSQSVHDNTVVFDYDGSSGEATVQRAVRVMDYVLSRCTGLTPLAELYDEVSRLFEIGAADTTRVVDDILTTLREAEIVTDF